MSEIDELKRKVNNFSVAREWDQFHSPKNLAMALSVEASELLEIFQWLDQEQSFELMADPEKKEKVSDELADIFIYLLRLSEKCDIELLDAANKKLSKNESKYPVSKFKGSARKYNEKE